MPVSREKDLIATMQTQRFGGGVSQDVCLPVSGHNLAFQLIEDSKRRWGRYTHEQNAACGRRIQEVRGAILVHAQQNHIDLAAVQAGTQELDSTLVSLFQTFSETAADLAQHNYGLVTRSYYLCVAKGRKAQLVDDQRLESIIQSGIQGLYDAAKRYDPEQGKFSSYAIKTIYGNMLKDMYRDEGSTYTERDYYNRYLQMAEYCLKTVKESTFSTVVTAMYLEGLGRLSELEHVVHHGFIPDSDDERSCRTLHTTMSHIIDLHQPDSLDVVVRTSDNEELESLGESIRDTSNIADDVEKQEMQRVVRETMASCPLSDRERGVLELRYGLLDGQEWTLEEIGRRYSVTRERIRQLEASALRKLRHPTRSRKLRDVTEG